MSRLFKLFKGSGILNLLGMAVAFSALYILLVQVYYDLEYNKGIKDSENIYVMAVPSWFTEGYYQVSINRPLGNMLASQSPTVESYGVARFNLSNKSSVFVGEGESRKEYMLGISELTRGALDVFSFTPIAGTFDGMEKEPTVAINESSAKLLEVGVGDVIRFSGSDEPLKIVAVYEDLPLNSDLGNIELFFCNMLERSHMDDWSEWGFNNFVKLKSKEDKIAFEEQALRLSRKIVIEEFVSKFPSSEVTEEDVQEYVDRCTVTLIPFSELYFKENLDNHSGRSGNYMTTLTLLVVAILIVLITLINFINFFFAQVPKRMKGTNVRKILGSSRARLVGSMMMESSLLVLLSLLAAVVIVIIFKDSTYANLISCSMDFQDNMPVIVLSALFAFFMTIASSIHPALYITSFSPAMAIKGSIGLRTKGEKFRYILIALQFIISISFVICAICVKNQHTYMMNYDMGFNKEYLLTADVPAGSYAAREAISDELMKSPQITDVTWAAGPLVNTSRMSWGRNFKDHSISFDAYPVSWDFLRFMGIEVVEGRDFTSSDEECENGIFIFNQIAKNKFGLTLEDRIQGHREPTEIAGFCKDFQFRPLQYDLNPFAFYVFGKDPWWQPTHVYLRCAPGSSISEVNKAFKETVLKFAPDYPVEKLEVSFFDQELGRQYYKEKNLTTMVKLFTMLAIIISLMGVFGLVVFETQYRRKEIGIRRVAGATIGEILFMFNGKFIKLLIACFAIAAPLSWTIVKYYYSTFAYSADISAFTFISAFLLVSVIVCTVVIVGSLKASMENPVLSLRSE